MVCCLIVLRFDFGGLWVDVVWVVVGCVGDCDFIWLRWMLLRVISWFCWLWFMVFTVLFCFCLGFLGLLHSVCLLSAFVRCGCLC